MKVNIAAAISTAVLLATGAHADDAQKVLKDSSSQPAADPASPAAQPTPTFTPTKIKGEFVEQFTDDWEQRWKASHAVKELKDSDQSEEEWAYIGEWSVEEPSAYKGMIGDKGLVVKNAAAHHAISAKFPKKIDPTGKTLVVQYEVKLQNSLECGGAYLKLLRDTQSLHQDEFSNTTPYVIMFGPDKCGATNKIHFIFNHKNPVTNEYEEKHVTEPPTANIVKTTELYTLIVHPNNTFVMQRNGDQIKMGNLLEDFSPPVNPSEEIDDPEDMKPEDWVDELRIPEPDATKPEDWDEDAPYEIVDEDATVPDDWLVDEPETIPDPEAQKPSEWNDEEDGDWIAPLVTNPKCIEASGCGPWTKPMIKNPKYKGKWSAPYVDNPAYKGKWAPRKIKNTGYFVDTNPANFEPMGAIGFEIWTMQNNILFDNIYIGHSVEDARKFAEETFFEKQPIEQLSELAEKPKEDKKKKKPSFPSTPKFLDDPVLYVKEKFSLFVTIAQRDPVEAIKFVPEVAGGIGAVLVTLVAVVVGVMSLGGAAPAPVKKAAVDAKEKVKDAKDKVVDAAATGAEAVKDNVNKRAKGSQS